MESGCVIEEGRYVCISNVSRAGWLKDVEDAVDTVNTAKTRVGGLLGF